MLSYFTLLACRRVAGLLPEGIVTLCAEGQRWWGPRVESPPHPLVEAWFRANERILALQKEQTNCSSI